MGEEMMCLHDTCQCVGLTPPLLHYMCPGNFGHVTIILCRESFNCFTHQGLSMLSAHMWQAWNFTVTEPIASVALVLMPLTNVPIDILIFLWKCPLLKNEIPGLVSARHIWAILGELGWHRREREELKTDAKLKFLECIMKRNGLTLMQSH